jgi:hypothetical protein
MLSAAPGISSCCDGLDGASLLLLLLLPPRGGRSLIPLGAILDPLGAESDPAGLPGRPRPGAARSTVVLAIQVVSKEVWSR